MSIVDIFVESKINIKNIDTQFILPEKLIFDPATYISETNKVTILSNFLIAAEYIYQDFKLPYLAGELSILLPDAFYNLPETKLIKIKEKALADDKTGSPVKSEHYGDIMFYLGNIDAAVDNWKKAKANGDQSPVLERKINEKKYIE